jgi:hypothetical protein
MLEGASINANGLNVIIVVILFASIGGLLVFTIGDFVWTRQADVVSKVPEQVAAGEGSSKSPNEFPETEKSDPLRANQAVESAAGPKSMEETPLEPASNLALEKETAVPTTSDGDQPMDGKASKRPSESLSSKLQDVIHASGVFDVREQREVPVEPPSRSMSLKLKRSQRPATITGKVIFILDARIGLNAEEHALVKKYQLGELVVYDSKTRERHREAANAHLETMRDYPSASDGTAAHFFSVGKTLFRLGRASVSATMAALSLRITVDGLIRGVHVECKSMDELLGAENAIREAAANLKGYLETAATFDGREEIIEL